MDADRLRDGFRERPLAEVITTLCEIEALRRAVHAAELEAIADVDARQGWRADGCASMVDWLGFRLSMSRKTAHEFLDAARSVGDLPHLAAAFGTGEISWDKTRAVAAVAAPESDAALVDQAKVTEVADLERTARRARAVSREEADARHHSRFLSLRRNLVAGGVRLSGFLPDLDGETVMKAIERLADDIPADPDTGLQPRFDERCADALVELAAGHLAAEQPVHGERAMVVAHVDVTSVGAGLVAETGSGIALAPETASQLLCDALVEPLVESEGRVTGRGKKHRFPPGWMRRKLIQRDRMCRFPGCCRMRMVHAHHIVAWPDGPTETCNLVMLCRYHHRLLHGGRWSIRGDPDEVIEFVKPNGEVLASHVPRVRDDLRRRLLGPLLQED